ncbi:unnamed protein product [Adineta steineri]|uniref:F-box domain-containing protein n=1 Tax=Adineta steineri TaxID=433720 RepID=A0A819FFF8_9BILA|nr:unnamed protein product [Adineta steineri]CAF3867638.1 unnamed protein product [Adineta steineri]
MNQHHKVNLLDLPNEILFLILKKLNNVDVLYSLININNQRLNIIAQHQIFTNNLNFSSILQSTNKISSTILNRLCKSILPRINDKIKSLTIESIYMKHILIVGHYPNLTQLQILNFNQETILHDFFDDSSFKHNIKQQITNLTLINNENNIDIEPKDYTKNVYANILTYFKNLKYLDIVVPYIQGFFYGPIIAYPALSLYDLSPTIFSSSTLTKLSINVKHLNDVYTLLDGRLIQLNILIVHIEHISSWLPTSYSMDSLYNLKCFSLTCYNITGEYDETVLSFIRRMLHLEELTLIFHISGRSILKSAADFDNKILIDMEQLHRFIFYIESIEEVNDLIVPISISDIEQSFTNIKYGQVACMIDYLDSSSILYRIFSLPTQFNYLDKVTNNIPNIIFNSVTYLKLQDKNPFKHEFFVRLQRSFPNVKHLSISNIQQPYWRCNERYLLEKDWCSIIEFSHPVVLDVKHAHFYYLEHFLNETKTYLPCLTELKVNYDKLKNITENFTKDEMRRNCSRVQQIFVERPIVYAEYVYRFFPSLL